MRLHPAVTQDEAHRWLKEQVERMLPAGNPPADLEDTLRQFAEAMAIVSAADVPDDVEPMFP